MEIYSITFNYPWWFLALLYKIPTFLPSHQVKVPFHQVFRFSALNRANFTSEFKSKNKKL